MVGVAVLAPDLAVQGIEGRHSAGIYGEQAQLVEFLGSEIDLNTRYAYPSLVVVDGQVTQYKWSGSRSPGHLQGTKRNSGRLEPGYVKSTPHQGASISGSGARGGGNVFNPFDPGLELGAGRYAKLCSTQVQGAKIEIHKRLR